MGAVGVLDRCRHLRCACNAPIFDADSRPSAKFRKAYVAAQDCWHSVFSFLFAFFYLQVFSYLLFVAAKTAVGLAFVGLAAAVLAVLVFSVLLTLFDVQP